MGDKSPKSRDKNKKQGVSKKEKKKAAHLARQAESSSALIRNAT